MPKTRAAEGLATSCGFVPSRAKGAKAPRVEWFQVSVLPDRIVSSPKSDVQSDVGQRWQGLAGRGKWTLPIRDVGYVTSLTRTELACVSERQYLERMPTVLRVGGFRFHLYSDEGTEPPHIHVRCAEGECKFWLDPVGLGRNRGVPPHVVREMERLVFEHVDLLLEKYDEHHPPGNRSRSDEGVD